MANNRLYLVDTGTYEWIMLAKGYTGGWDYLKDAPLQEFLESDDRNLEPRDLNAAGAFEIPAVTRLALFTEANLPKECGSKAWTPKRAAGKD